MARAKSKEKFLALDLRRQGMSYSQIKERVKVSKSSLSLWLKDYPLSKERITELRDRNEKRIEQFRNTMRKKREERWLKVYDREKGRLLPLSTKEWYLAGLFLYWGEGGKTATGQITLSNTDPEMLKFYVSWLEKGLGVPRHQIVVKLHLYKDMNELSETNYWVEQLGLSKTQFRKPYVKNTTLRGLTYKGLGHGTCNLMVYGRNHYEQVMLGIRVINGEFRGLW